MPDLDSIRLASPLEFQRPEKVNLHEAAQAFEGYFVGEMLRQGSQPIFGEGALIDSPGVRMYRELFFQELANIASRKGSFGLADVISQQVGGSSSTPVLPNKEKQ